jgi:hypothetical protein
MARCSLITAVLTMSFLTITEGHGASDRKRKPLPLPSPTASPSPLPTASPTPLLTVAPAPPSTSLSPSQSATPTRVPSPLPKAPATVTFTTGLDKPLPNYEPPTQSHLNLAGSRGETLYSLIKIKSQACFEMQWVDMQDDLQLKNPIRVNVKMYRLPKHDLNHTSVNILPIGNYYDSLIPLNATATNQFQVCSTRSEEWFAIEVQIPPDGADGNYTGILTADQINIANFNLEIWKMLWQRPNEMRVHSSLISWFNLLAHYGGYNSDEANLQNKYINAMRESGFTPTFAWVAVPPILQNSNGEWYYDYANYPKTISSYQELVLKKEPSGWVQLPIPSLDKIEADPVKTLSALENSIHIWNLSGRAYVYLMDEIHSSDYPRLHSLANLFHQYAPSAKILVTTKYVPEIENDIDIFVVLAEYWDSAGQPEPQIYKDLKAKGKDVWLYVSCMSHGCSNSTDSGTPDYVLDRPSVYLRNIGTMMAKYDIKEFLYWRMNHAYTNASPMISDPWTTQLDFDGQGDGNMMYPIKPGMFDFSTHEPGLSLRMKLTQEFLNDRIYHYWMAQKQSPPDWWRTEINSLVRNSREWSHNYADYELLRRKMGRWLNSQP